MQPKTKTCNERHAGNAWRITGLLICLLSVGMVDAGPVELTHRKTGIAQPNDPVVFDVNADGRYEILLSGADGSLGVFEPKTVKTVWWKKLLGMSKPQDIVPLWVKKISGKALTQPVVGSFAGTGSLLIAVGCSDGVVYLVEPGTGEVTASRSVGVPIAVAPSVVPLGDIGDNTREGLVVCDDSGKVRVLSLAEEPKQEAPAGTEQKLQEIAAVAAGARVMRPASSGNINGDGVPYIVVGTAAGTVVTFALNNSREPHSWSAPQGTKVATCIAMADFYHTGREYLAFGLENRTLMVLKYQHRENTDIYFQEVQTQKMMGIPNGDLVVADFNDDGTLDVAGATDTGIASFNGAAAVAAFAGDPYLCSVPPPSNVAVAGLGTGKSTLVFGDRSGNVCLLDPTLRKQPPDYYSGVGVIGGFGPAGDLTGEGRIEVVLLTQDRTHLTVARLSAAAAREAIPTIAPGVSFRRDCQWTTGTAALLARLKERHGQRFASLLADARAKLDARDYREALRLADMAVAMRPEDEKATDLRGQIQWRMHLIRNLLFRGALLAAIAYAGLVVFRTLLRRHRIRHAGRQAELANHAAAIAEYRAILEKEPRNRRIATELALVYTKANLCPPEAIDVLEIAHAADPENSAFTTTLARAYSATRSETDTALEVYLPALVILETDRADIAYCAANAQVRRGELEQALRNYKIAVREGHEPMPVYEKMADIYLRTSQFNEKTLPVFESVISRHPDNIELLEGLCRSYVASRRTDEPARSACERLLALKPDALVALVQLARIHLQAGAATVAAEYAERARTIAPGDPEVVNLVCHSYLLLGRTDATASDVYRQSLAHNSTQPDILRAAAHAVIASGNVDGDSYQLMQRAVTANPGDNTLLMGLAQMAEEKGDLTVLIRAFEGIIALGVQDPEVVRGLATAYYATDNFTPESERIYREALRTDPDNLDALKALGRITVQQNRMDADAMLVLEKAFQRESSDLALGKHLAHTYVKNERYDDAIRMAQRLLEQCADDENLQKLFAEASLRNNQLDEAIRQYEHLLKQHPGDRETTVNLAFAYVQKQRTDDTAGQHYEQALRIDANLAPVRMMFARYHATAGRLARGIEEYRRALASSPRVLRHVTDDFRRLIAENPERPDLRWFIAEILIDSGNLTEAMEHLQALFEIDPSQAKAILQAYDRILAKDPSNAAANLNKGSLLKIQGRFEESKTFLDRAYQANPASADAARELEDLLDLLVRETDNIEMRFELGKLCYAQRNYDKAIEHFQRTMQDFRFENESFKMLGLCCVGKGMLDPALEQFNKLVIDEEMKGILYDLARRYEQKNDLVGAKQVYRKLFTADITYRDVKARFEMLAGHTSDPITMERTALLNELGEKARLRYELLEEVGRGAMGIVYKAKDNELDEEVALKILPDNLSKNPDAVQRFRAEARSARRLAHPNIVRIHDIGEEMGRKYISMEFVKGIDLKKHFRQKGRLSPQDVVSVVRQICQALDYAHSMGIVHRDIKPANIMLTEQMMVKVSDFGIAKMLESTGDTAVGAIIGTPLYMSPEQVQGQPVDNRADIYSLGILMYELLCGRPPFTEGDLAYQHMRVKPKPIDGIASELNGIVLRCLEKDRDRRWATAGEMLRALDKLPSGKSLTP